MVKGKMSVSSVYLKNFELAGTVCKYTMNEGTFTELPSYQVEEKLIHRGTYSVLNGVFIAIYATPEGPGLIVDGNVFLLELHKVKVNFSSGEDVDLGAHLYSKQNNEQFFKWYTQT